MMTVLGIDIGKAEFHVYLLEGERGRANTFANSAKGFARLSSWLRNRKVARVHACLEATGHYGEAVALHLHEAGHLVSIVNPAAIKGFAKSRLTRTKTDAVDAALIAEFCARLTPRAWTPPAPALRALQALTRRLESLMALRQQEANRAGEPAPDAVHASIMHVIATLDVEIKALTQQIRDHIDQHPDLRAKHDLLVSIPGIGTKTAATLLGELPDIERFSGVRSLVAFVGLSCREHVSGSSVRGKPRLAKIGNARVRKALYFPAIVAWVHNPVLRPFAQRLAAAGKTKMVIVGALMRKLLHLAYGVLKNRTPFYPRPAVLAA